MIYLQNPGLIDPRCISTIGVSVKEGENPIGFFGTGLKYAIAIVLRLGGEITIWRGTEPLRFSTKDAEIRGANFKIICMNDQELGFTTHLGEHWECWQAFRELYCNALDEGGSCWKGDAAPQTGLTLIEVDCGEFSECYDRRGDFILDSKPYLTCKGVEWHKRPSKGVFFKSILVGALGPEPMRFAPNIQNKIALTEDRTIGDRSEVLRALSNSIIGCEDAQFIRDYVTTGEGFAEHDIDMDWHMEPGRVFIDAIVGLCRNPTTASKVNRSAKELAFRHAPKPAPIPCEPLPHEKHALKEAIHFARSIGFSVDDFPIVVVESLGELIMGQADRNTNTILIARYAIQQGDLYLASTLIEEWAHLKHGYNDLTLEMQNWLFQQVVNMGKALIFERTTK